MKERRKKGLSSSSLKLRHRQTCEDTFDDLLARDLLGFGFVTDDDAMAKHVGAYGFYIVRGDIPASCHKCARPRRKTP